MSKNTATCLPALHRVDFGKFLLVSVVGVHLGWLDLKNSESGLSKNSEENKKNYFSSPLNFSGMVKDSKFWLKTQNEDFIAAPRDFLTASSYC